MKRVEAAVRYFLFADCPRIGFAASVERSQSSSDRSISADAYFALHRAEGELVWSRFNAMLIANSVIGAIVGAVIGGQGFGIPVLGIVIFLAVVGFLICRSWHDMTKRGWALQRFWLDQIRSIQPPLADNPMSEYRRWTQANPGTSINNAAHGVTRIFGLTYLLVGASSAVALTVQAIIELSQ